MTKEKMLLKAVKEARQFISSLLNVVNDDEAIDFLVNNGEEVENMLKETIKKATKK
jgi:hypothetical protein